MNVRVERSDGDVLDAWFAIPAAPTDTAIVVLQEIFGVTRKIRGYCDLFAGQGYAALAPDLFWRMQRNVDLSYSEEDVAKARSFLARFEEDKAIGDLEASVEHLRRQGYRKIVFVGFCLGGKLGPLALASGIGDAAIAFYGVGLERALDQLRRIQVPVQFHFGDQDSHVSAAIAPLETLAAEKPNFAVFRYAEAGHAFFRPDLKDENSKVAWQRTQLFLEEMLK